MLIMAIETSCDETACAVVEDGVKEIATAIATSAELHQKTGGIVPEVAARKQVEYITPVIELCMKKAADHLRIDTENVKNHIDALAVTVGPGLIGSLLVGVEAAKTLALAWSKPLIPVNHLVGHIYANFLLQEGIKPPVLPAVALVVSGGHTDIILLKDHGRLEHLGGTIDDAAGESFDKVARLLNTGSYLGGPALAKNADLYTGPNLPEKLPRALLHETTYNFSFSGLKTAVKRLVDRNMYEPSAIAKEFQEAVIEVLVNKTLKAVQATGVTTLLLGGGVSANNKLRTNIVEKARAEIPELKISLPPLRLCSDNAIYIASAGYFNQEYMLLRTQDLHKINPNPALAITD